MPIPIEVLKRVTVVYTHNHCPDGMASAMILKDAFRMLGMNPCIEFLAHNTPEHEKAGLSLGPDAVSLFCDIAPHWSAAVVMKNRQTERTIVLDHHKGAEEVVRSFGELGVFADEKLEPGVSGAVLAFREVWMVAQANREDARRDVGTAPVTLRSVEDFALSVGARDTWQTGDARFRRGQWISKLLMSKPASYWLGDVTNADNHRTTGPYMLEAEVQIGRALFEAHEEAVRQAVDQCVQFKVGTVPLYVFQEQASGFRLCSDVAESFRHVDEQQCVVAGFSYVVDKPGDPPKLLYSLRGLNGFDVAAFAKANGGGGHTAAAGFSVDSQLPLSSDDTPYDFISRKLQEFLAR